MITFANKNHYKRQNMSDANDNVQVLIIHVRGNEERKRYVQKQVDRLGMPCEYILDGNVEDLTPEIIDRYFKDNGREDTMRGAFPRTSCAYKHLLACRYIVEHNLDGALILEDDIRLYDNFRKVFSQSMAEYHDHHADEPFMANYEESGLMFIPRSQRVKGQVLYQVQRDRFTGCFFINRKAAEIILEYTERDKMELAIDRQHSKLVQEGLLTYYWSHPCIACQCSCDGSMPTMIPTRPRPYKRLKWFYKRFYKHLLYWFR